jgi:hypothetical protein
VVRHNLVQQIIRAYEEHDASHPTRGGNGQGSARELPAAEKPVS